MQIFCNDMTYGKKRHCHPGSGRYGSAELELNSQEEISFKSEREWQKLSLPFVIGESVIVQHFLQSFILRWSLFVIE